MRESTMREQELEVVKTAYFWEDQIVHQTQELQRVNTEIVFFIFYDLRFCSFLFRVTVLLSRSSIIAASPS